MIMKHMPYYMAFLGFFITLIFTTLMGNVLNLDWLKIYYSKDTSSDGFVFEGGMAWLPIILAVLVGHLGWKLGKRVFSQEKLDS